jgi:O-antigen/teichoic acid export membrane protein
LSAQARTLFRDVAIYGAGDVATSAINFLLLPLFTSILTTEDYGVLALLLSIEAGAKILLRWGADAAFMRLYYDCPDLPSRQLLASTIVLFLVAVNAPVLFAVWVAAPWLSDALFQSAAHAATLRAFFLNTFLLGFFFVPFHVYRIEGRSARFAALTFSRAAGQVVLRLIFIAGLDLGVFGIVAADLVLTVAIGGALLPSFARLVRARFSMALLRDALGVGLPRVPHGMAHQATALADRWILLKYVSIDRIGIYGIGVSIGLGLKLFLSAFEYAWAPFYLDAMKRPEAKAIYRRITTYVVALLAFLATGLAAVSDEIVALMTAPAFQDAAGVVPWIAIGVLCQGFYQLTAIGLNITKRTAFLPLATGGATAVAIGVNLLLVPEFGILGAAWTYALSYATLALLGFVLSQHVYPVQYEWRRLTVIAIASVAAYLLALLAARDHWPLLARLLARGGTVAVALPALLAAGGVFRPEDLRSLATIRERLRPAGRGTPSGEEVELGGEIAATPSIVEGAALAPTDADARDRRDPSSGSPRTSG